MCFELEIISSFLQIISAAYSKILRISKANILGILNIIALKIK